MESWLYTNATKGNTKVLIRYKDQLLNQISYPSKHTVLHVIAQHNDSADAIREILSGQDSSLLESLLTWQNAEGETALYIAARNRRKHIVQQLITSAQALSPLPDLEAGDGVMSLVSRMARLANKNGDTPLHEAINNKDVEMVELLVKADPNYQHLPNKLGKTPLYIAFEKRATKDVHSTSKFHSCLESTPLDNFSYDSILKTIVEVCKSPGIEGPHGETVLHAAVRREETTSQWVISRLPNFKNIMETQDEQGFTPLHFAAYFGNPSAVTYLLQSRERDRAGPAYIAAAEDKHESMTPIHIAASKGHTEVIEKILQWCEDCWDAITSKGQNILHLAAKGQHTTTIKYILKQSWGINLLNMKDYDGNTPSHLLLSSMPKDYKTIRPLLHDPNVYVDTYNHQHSTPLEMLEKAEIQFSAKKVHIMNKLQNKFRKIEEIPWMIDDHAKRISEEVTNKPKRVEEMKKTAEKHLLVATLIATVTFAAGFTLPGGYNSDDPDKGLAVLLRKAAFKVFVVTDTIALMSSCVAIFLHFAATLYKNDEEKISNRYSAALLFLVIAMISMAITFMTGVYVVLAKSPTIGMSICIIGCVVILSLLYLIIVAYRDTGVLIEEYLFEMICFVADRILLFPFRVCGSIMECLGFCILCILPSFF